METSLERNPTRIDSLSIDKLLSTSKVFKDSIRYGKNCLLNVLEADTDLDLFKYPIRLNAYVFVVCSKGLIELTCNLYTVELSSGSMFIYNPDTIIKVRILEPSHLNVFVCERDFIDGLGIKIENVPNQYSIVRTPQAFPISDKSCSDIWSMMSITAEAISLDKSNAYYGEMVRSLFRSFIYRALYELKKLHDVPKTESYLPSEIGHFERFMRLLEIDYKRERSIRYYAGKMNLTPKYLSLVIKKTSGKLATEWIDEYIILEAKNLIKYSAMSIQEITYELNFPNQSFFGKYFKRHTGMSPKAYRRQP